MSRGRRSMHLSGRQQGTGVCLKAACRWVPMSWEGRDRCFLVGAQPNRFAAVATVFRGKDKLVLPQIKVTIRPAVVGAALELHQLLRRLIGAKLWRIEVRPVFPQLVAAVLGRKCPARGVECDPFPVAQPGREARGGRKALSG